MDCIHKPVIKLNQLMSRRARYTCRHCGAEIEMTSTFSGINRSLSMVVIMLLLLKVMGNNTSFGLTGTAKLLVDLGMMLSIVLLYLIAMLVLIRLGKFQEIKIEPEVTAEQQPGSDAEQQTLTQEQLDLIAMYQEYERKAGIEPSSAAAGEIVQSAQKAELVPEEDTCEHIPKASWKNYIPGQFNFVCKRCEKPITLPPAFVKKINMILMLISFAILIPFISDFNMKFWIFGLLTLLVLLIGVVLQIYVLRKGKFIMKP